MRALLVPRMLVAHLVAVAAVTTAFVLAWWQYDAWQARRAAEEVDLTTLAPVALAEAIGPDQAFPGDRVGQPVEVSGTWLATTTVLISGRELGGVDGYWVVTPLSVTETGSAIPVVRGWTADPDDVPGPGAREADLVGYLQPSEGRVIGDDDPTDDVYPQLRTADLLQRVDQDLYGAYVVADAESTGRLGGLEPATVDQLPEVGRFTALRNLLYAIEWVLFGCFAGYVWWKFVRDELDQTDRDPDDRHPDDRHPDDREPEDPGSDDPGSDDPGSEDQVPEDPVASQA